MSLVTVEFLDRGEETDIVITHTQLRDEALRNGTAAGWDDVVACIARCLSTAT
ncbi:MAG: hypothetical protein JWM41_2456 [Gemmatimonadetes bacterium]|nr:hypothetical protein [Gemmatimonadota bacterium]